MIETRVCNAYFVGICILCQLNNSCKRDAPFIIFSYLLFYLADWLVTVDLCCYFKINSFMKMKKCQEVTLHVIQSCLIHLRLTVEND